MLIRNFLRITATLLLMISLAGCGNDSNSNTNGTLTLNVPSPPTNGGTAFFSATAKVVPGRSGTLSGIPVSFTAVQIGTDPSTTSVFTLTVSSGELKTDNTGSVTWSYNFLQKTFNTTIQVTVNVDGLVQTTTVNVPKA